MNQKKAGVTILILDKTDCKVKALYRIKKINLTKAGTFHIKAYMLSNSAERYRANTAENRRKKADHCSGKHFTSTLAVFSRYHKSQARI